MLKNLPDLTFAESDPGKVDTQIVTVVEGLLGRTLAAADPLRLFLRGIEAIMVQQRILIDEAAKQNLLAYATGNNLDHLGILVGADRLAATAATTTMQLNLSAIRDTATAIPKGTRFTAGDGVMFALDADAIIEKGKIMTTAAATCTAVGSVGNGYAAGEVKSIVDPQPFLASAANTTTTAGGADIESDDNYRENIQEAPEGLSTAGPTGAYEYHAKRASTLISDVSVETPTPGCVTVRPLLDGGVIPGDEILKLVDETLNDRTIRPLTDHVSVEAPTAITYNIKAKYWIDRDDATTAAAIQTAASTAVTDFIAWQKSRLGRDINPTELYYRLRAAGIKRAEITEPVFTALTRAQVAIADTVAVSFEGLEDD